MPKLTFEQWRDVKAPFCFLHVLAPASWQTLHFNIIEKWLDANVQGWWYGNVQPADTNRRVAYIFERNADRVMFKLWISDDPLSRDVGEIEIVNVVPEAEVDL